VQRRSLQAFGEHFAFQLSPPNTLIISNQLMPKDKLALALDIDFQLPGERACWKELQNRQH
jgi:hypothetical protein